jgi:hypothetical protein
MFKQKEITDIEYKPSSATAMMVFIRKVIEAGSAGNLITLKNRVPPAKVNTTSVR